MVLTLLSGANPRHRFRLAGPWVLKNGGGGGLSGSSYNTNYGIGALLGCQIVLQGSGFRRFRLQG